MAEIAPQVHEPDAGHGASRNVIAFDDDHKFDPFRLLLNARLCELLTAHHRVAPESLVYYQFKCQLPKSVRPPRQEGHLMHLLYYWRGDNDADAGENGLVTFATGGTCANPTGTTTLATHPLTTLTWQSNTVPLPASLNNTVFFARFFAGTNAGTESFRVDGLTYTGTSI